jgi:hypothetical protein
MHGKNFDLVAGAYQRIRDPARPERADRRIRRIMVGNQ